MDDIYENPSVLIGGPFCKVEFERTNINSPVQLKDFLLSQGWEPTSFTDKGSPQITEDSFHTIKGDMGKLLAERAVLKHRLGMLFSVSNNGEMKGWINTVRDDSRLEAGGIPQATNTGRYRHSGVVNVPKASEKVPYGIQLRSLFIAKPGYVLVGVDAKALESRIEAHYCYPYKGGKEHAETLLEGDIHQKTADFLKIDRNTAKTVRYATVYGAQPKKLADTLGCSVKEAESIYNGFWEAQPALKSLIDAIGRAYKTRGYLIGLDGRKLYPRSHHSAPNTLFQGGGIIVVKTAMAYCHKRTAHIDCRQVIQMHDEFQSEVIEKSAEEYARLAEGSFVSAGEFYNMNVRMEGEAKIGMNWALTH